MKTERIWKKAMTGQHTCDNLLELMVVPNISTGGFACFVGVVRLEKEFREIADAIEFCESVYWKIPIHYLINDIPVLNWQDAGGRCCGGKTIMPNQEATVCGKCSGKQTYTWGFGYGSDHRFGEFETEVHAMLAAELGLEILKLSRQ